MTGAETSGYVLKFRCVYCGRHEVSVEYPCEGVLPMDEIKARIYEGRCCACGWNGEVCGDSAVQIYYSLRLRLKVKVRGKGH
jgi:heterodisulfide reductase subunit A-like polyferredoxin